MINSAPSYLTAVLGPARAYRASFPGCLPGAPQPLDEAFSFLARPARITGNGSQRRQHDPGCVRMGCWPWFRSNRADSDLRLERNSSHRKSLGKPRGFLLFRPIIARTLEDVLGLVLLAWCSDFPPCRTAATVYSGQQPIRKPQSKDWGFRRFQPRTRDRQGHSDKTYRRRLLVLGKAAAVPWII